MRKYASSSAVLLASPQESLRHVRQGPCSHRLLFSPFIIYASPALYSQSHEKSTSASEVLNQSFSILQPEISKRLILPQRFLCF